MKKYLCSYCGKETVSIEEHEVDLSEPYGGTSTVKIQEKVCSYCGFSEEDDGNDLVIKHELSELKRVSMVKVLDALNAMGHTNASMERSLGLPARTLARWKNEYSISPSASGIALMRIIRTYPWILGVADMQFDPKSARNKLIVNAANECIKIHSEHPEWKLASSARVSGNFLEIHISGLKNHTTKAISGENYVFTLLN